MMMKVTKRWSSALHLEKKKEKNKNGLKAKVYVIVLFLFCTQDTIEGVSDLGSIAVLWREEFHDWKDYQVPLSEYIWAYALGPSVS
jgi:hypothetical protein